MNKIKTTSTFEKNIKLIKKNHPSIYAKFKETYESIRMNKFHELVHDHPLRNKMHGLRAYALSSEYRVVYKRLDVSTVLLVDIGDHSVYY